MRCGFSSGRAGCAPQRARNQAEAAGQQDEHDERVEQAGLPEVDVHVHQDAGQDDGHARDGQDPAGAERPL